MSAQVTEAHIARARASGYTTDKGLQMAAQFIANNEAAKAERDQLRAEVAWWKNWHEENEKLEDGIAVKVQATIDQLRAEVERLKAQRDNLLKPMREQAIARAERAEAELAAERARLRIVEEFMLRRHIPQAEDDYPQIWLGNGYFDTLADAADAAMKEGAK